MAIESHQEMADLTVDELYLVYLAIAQCDHQWRRQSLYGGRQLPKNQCDLRPLDREQFVQRFKKAKTFVGGELMLRQRLARQAATYDIDLSTALSAPKVPRS